MRRIKNHFLNGLYFCADRNYLCAHWALNVLKRLRVGLHGYAIVTYGWIDQSNVVGSGELRGESDVVATAPNRIGVDQGKHENVKSPQVFWRHFRNVRVNACSSSVIDETDVLYLERLARGNQAAFDYSGGHVKFHGRKYAIVRSDGKAIERGIFFAGNGSWNYYHWLIEIITKSQFFDDLPDDFSQYPLLVNRVAREVPSFIDTLSKIAKGREIYYLDPEESYFVDSLIFIDGQNNLPFNLVSNNKFKVGDFIFRAESIDYLRAIYLKPLIDRPGSSVLFNGLPKRIFLARRNGRRLFNQDEAEFVLMKYGFTSVTMESISFEQQVLLFNNADWIVGPTGAAWTNIAFAKEGTKCICWMAEEYGEFSAFSTLANLVGADLRYLIYETGAKSTHELYNKSYQINIELLEQSLKMLGAESFDARCSATKTIRNLNLVDT